MSPDSVAVAYCHPDELNGQFHRSMVRAILYDQKHNGNIVGHISLNSGPRIASGRNNLVREFLRHPAAPQWMFMVDADMVFTPDIIDRLLEVADPQARPIVGGLCFGGGRGGKVFPTLYRLEQVEDRIRVSPPITDYPENAVVKVDATGTACLLIHRSVFVTIARWFDGTAYPWFTDGELNHKEVGEDIMFCLRCRAVDIPIFVHTGVTLGHMKTQVIDEVSFREFEEKGGEEEVKEELKQRLRLYPEMPEMKYVSDAAAPTYVVVPVKDRLDLTTQLLEQLYDQGGYDGIFVFDNGSGEETAAYLRAESKAKRITYQRCPDDTITQMWNRGLHLAADISPGPFNVAILNNDLELGPGFLVGLAAQLRKYPHMALVCPNYDGRDLPPNSVVVVDGTAKNAGVSGFAFMLKGELFGDVLPYIDEGFQWWWGDDDLVRSVNAAGMTCGLVSDVTVVHIDGGSQSWDTSDVDYNETLNRDAAYHYAKWERL